MGVELLESIQNEKKCVVASLFTHVLGAQGPYLPPTQVVAKLCYVIM